MVWCCPRPAHGHGPLYPHILIDSPGPSVACGVVSPAAPPVVWCGGFGLFNPPRPHCGVVVGFGLPRPPSPFLGCGVVCCGGGLWVSGLVFNPLPPSPCGVVAGVKFRVCTWVLGYLTPLLPCGVVWGAVVVGCGFRFSVYPLPPPVVWWWVMGLGF